MKFTQISHHFPHKTWLPSPGSRWLRGSRQGTSPYIMPKMKGKVTTESNAGLASCQVAVGGIKDGKHWDYWQLTGISRAYDGIYVCIDAYKPRRSSVALIW